MIDSTIIVRMVSENCHMERQHSKMMGPGLISTKSLPERFYMNLFLNIVRPVLNDLKQGLLSVVYKISQRFCNYLGCCGCSSPVSDVSFLNSTNVFHQQMAFAKMVADSAYESCMMSRYHDIPHIYRIFRRYLGQAD